MSFIIMNEWRIEESLFINQHIFWFPKKNHFSLINYCNKLEDRPWKLIFWIHWPCQEVQKSFSEPFVWILWFQVSSSIKTCLKLWNLFIGKIVNAAILFFYKKQFLKLLLISSVSIHKQRKNTITIIFPQQNTVKE